MPLGPGDRLGPYEVVSAIGAGGMGEVYRARDTRLGREVAIKVLPDSFANDPDRLARFEREAQLLASLNHPNIAIVHGLEEAGKAGEAGGVGVRALVMELVEGPTLADRIARGPIPVDEALPIARQIAEALEAAHERGVIHRDLKPANIKLTASGQVKVLDFGLAKLAGPPEGGPYVPGVGAGFSPPDASMRPTMTSPAIMTGVGMLIGTAAYMSPEQARGKPVDRRADIWAFGCVLYEMLTGKQAFEAGETVSDAVAAILKNEPDWSALPPDTPPQIRTLLRRCLQKDPQKRLPHIGVARLEIDEGPLRTDTLHVTAGTAVPRRQRPWIVASAALGLATTMFGAAVAFIHFRETPPDSPVVRWTLLPPDNTTFNSDFTQGVGLPTLSPDGKRIVFGTRSADGAPLWVRSLDALTAQPLAGTDRARFPFWSPDSRFVAFFADGKLKKIEASGGPVLTLADAPNGRGGSWNRDGVIIFSPTTTDSPLLRVSASGGTTSRVSSEEGSFPWFLPDGRHFLYQGFDGPGGQPGIRVGALDGSPSTLVGRGSNALYAQGHVLFVREGTLMAQPFDVDRLTTTGDAIPVAERVQNVLASGRAAAFSVSETGLLAYREGRPGGGYTLTWVDRSGTRGATIGAPHFTVGDIQFSPDRTRVAVAIQEGTNNDIWIYDVGRGLRTRFTSDPGNDTSPVWSPDGRTIIFRSNRKGHYDLYRKMVDSIATEELLYADELDKSPTSFSPDGKLLLYYAGRPEETDINLWMLPLTADGQNVALKPSTLLATPFNEGLAQFSPDGRWILYVSDESKRNEVYLSPFVPPHGLAGKRQISVAGMIGVNGGTPRWRRDGREIFYVGPDRRLMSTEVSIVGERLNVGMTRPLFGMLTELRQTFEVSVDGQRFLLLGTDDDKEAVPITLVQNWPASLKN